MRLDEQLLDEQLLDDMLKNGYVTKREGPYGYSIFNYTNAAQYDNEWNDVTETCRGLIVNAEGNVIARPFRKFHNLAQLTRIPDGTPWAYEKVDGSLGIGYDTPDGPAISTRGSMESEQALWATEWLRSPVNAEHAAWVQTQINRGLTPLFEIVYPENRIVVDYGDVAELVLLDCVSINDGRRYMTSGWPGRRAESLGPMRLDELADLDSETGEGFVLCWEDGTMAKYKYPTYVARHKLLSGFNERRCWELLSLGSSTNDILDMLPDEWHDWARRVCEDLVSDYVAVMAIAADAVHDASVLPDRKSQAQHILASGCNTGVAFKMLDGQPFDEAIWKSLRPGSGEESGPLAA